MAKKLGYWFLTQQTHFQLILSKKTHPKSSPTTSKNQFSN